jgi:hypothetical protein
MPKIETLGSVASSLPEPKPTPEAPAAEWYLMDGVPGQGARPDWLLPNFNNAAEQAKAYPSLRKTLGAQQGAPEEYNYGELAEELDLDNPVLQEFKVYAKENRLSQEAFEQIHRTYLKLDQSRRPDVSKELAKLGPDGATKVKIVENWVKNNFSPEAAKILDKVPPTAEYVNFFDELRQRSIQQQVRIPGETDPGVEFKKLTVEEVEAEMWSNKDRYYNDKAYRDQITRKFAQAAGEE